MLKKFAMFVMALALLGLFSGCSSDSTSATGDDISSEFGGFEPTSEAPAFSNSILTDEMEGDVAFDDAMETDSVVQECLSYDNTDVYALRIIWGKLRYDSTVMNVTDWSGTLTLSRGAILLRRVIRFEPSTDWIVMRDNRATLSWVSLTTVHHDGIFVNLIIPPVDETEDSDEPVTVTFDTEPFSITFNVEDIAALDTIYHLDDSNAVAFEGFKVDRVPCPKGFLAGYWGKDEDGNGVFFGSWMGHHGFIIGHLEGTWGVNNEGEEDNVFYGKYIDDEGNFMGLLKGTFKSKGSSINGMHGNQSGWFRGNYYDGDGNVLGVLRGHYHEQPRSAGFGFFQGRWRDYCNEEIAGAIADGLDE